MKGIAMKWLYTDENKMQCTVYPNRINGTSRIQIEKHGNNFTQEMLKVDQNEACKWRQKYNQWNTHRNMKIEQVATIYTIYTVLVLQQVKTELHSYIRKAIQHYPT